MAYSTQTDLVNYFPAEQLKQLTDDDDTDEIQTEKVNDAIRRADNFIDGHLQGRYTLPLATVPPMIRDMSTRLAVYFLFNRALVLTMPEPVKDDYKLVKSTLEQVQRGKVNPFPNTSDEPTFFTTNKTASDAVFTSSTQPAQGQISWSKYPI